MWRSFGQQLARAAASSSDDEDHHNGDGEEEPHVVAEAKQRAGQLWSRFVEIAADITQQDDQNDEEEEEYEEGEGWGEDDGIEGSWQEDEPELHDGSYDVDDDKQGQGQDYEEQVGDDQQCDDNPNGDMENEWGEGDQVDFSVDHEQQEDEPAATDEAQFQQQDEERQQQPLFGDSAEMLSPIAHAGARHESANVESNDWDLDEADIYGDEDVVQEEARYGQEDLQQQQQAPAHVHHDTPGGHGGEEENAWDDSLNVGDDDVDESQTKLLAWETPVLEDAPLSSDEPDVGETTDAWEEEDLQFDDSTSPPLEADPLPEYQEPFFGTPAEVTDMEPQPSDGAWGMDDGSDLNLEEEEPAAHPFVGDVAEDPDTGDVWDEDDGLKDLGMSNDDIVRQDPNASSIPATEHIDAWDQDDGFNDLDFSAHDGVIETVPQAQSETTLAKVQTNAWDQHDSMKGLDLSNDDDAVESAPQTQSETTPAPEPAEAWDQQNGLNDLELSNNDGVKRDEHENVPIPETVPAGENAWSDSSRHNPEADNAAECMPETTGGGDDNDWGDDSALNFDDEVIGGSLVSGYSSTLPLTEEGQEALEPAAGEYPVETPSDSPDAAVETGNGGCDHPWDDSAFNLDIGEHRIETLSGGAVDYNAVENAWDNSDINFDDDYDLAETTPNPYAGLVDDDDASTVGQSNTGGEQSEFDDFDQADEKEQGQADHVFVTTESGDASTDKVVFYLPGRTPSRRRTMRVSNKSKDSKGDDAPGASDGHEEPPAMISDVAISNTQPGDGSSGFGGEGHGRVCDATTLLSEDPVASGASIAEDVMETQISLMTLKSIADSCPSRQLDNKEDEAGFGPVVDKIPDLNPEPSVPATSTMTINSTAVTAPSVDDDIRQDDDMDGTFYGGSTVDGPLTENAWEADDSSLGVLNETTPERIVEGGPGEAIVNITIPEETTAHIPLTIPCHLVVVDGTPDAAVKNRLSSSMAVLSHSDENSVPSRDRDDDDEDDFKPVVDQIPPPVKLSSNTSEWTGNSLSVVADHVEQDVKEDDDMDGCESSSDGGGGENRWDDDGICLDGELEGDSPTPEGGEAAERRASPSLREVSPVVVFDTPDADGLPKKLEGSVVAVASVEDSCLSREHDSDEENAYGPVVDQIPELHPLQPDHMSMTASSVAVVAHNVEEDVKLDEEMDGSYGGGSTLDDVRETEWDENSPTLEGSNVEHPSEEPTTSSHCDLPSTAADPGEVGKGADRVVDLTPKLEARRIKRMSSNSMAVLAYSVAQDFDDNDEDEEDDANFGPIVDVTPTPRRLLATTPSSTAVLRGERKQDDTIDDGIDDINWDDECPELEEEESEGAHADKHEEHKDSQNQETAQAAAANTEADPGQVVLVDHTPAGETSRKRYADASLAVLAPSDDGTGLSIDDDDDVDGNVDGMDPFGEGVSYGPVVDITPAPSAQRPTPTAPSVSFSLVVEAHSIEDDLEMDETLNGDSTIDGNENGWGDDDAAYAEGLDEQFKDSSQPRQDNTLGGSAVGNEPKVAMVDHTPRADSRRRIIDPSLVALAPSIASTCRSDENEDCDTITNEQDVYGKVVDHTPKLAPYKLIPTSSLAVGAASVVGDIERDDELDATYFGDSTEGMGDNVWEDDDVALDDVELNKLSEQVVCAENCTQEDSHVVDHTPLTDEPMSHNFDPSVVALAPSDDGSLCRGENGPDDGGPEFGPVVDMTPEIPTRHSVATTSSLAVQARSLNEDIRLDEDLEATMYGDSTIDGAGGWEEDDAALEDIAADTEEGDEVASSSLVGASATFQESQPAQNMAEAPVVVVDHTPSEIGLTQKNASVAWISGTFGDNDTQDDVPDWDQSAPAVESAASSASQPAEEDQVVDHIPQRPESRYGDASTLVVADPSEVLSHVDDMLQEDFFGPVVDLTPPSRPSIPHALSAAGSTVVVAPTIPPDDLDDADDTVNAPDENGWDSEPLEIEQTPNPQSGNEEESTNRVREQVVDFLPPPQEEEAVDQNRDGWSQVSEVATGGAPSVFQADPKEDEFGPVVDQLPAQHPPTQFSAISTASQVASSECDALAREDETEADSKQEGKQSRVVVDPLPRPFDLGMQNLDSTASLAQSLASEDEDDDCKYGPVVDHLPTSRSSLAPSRGGSTVDALATVSEVIDDDDDDDDDDGNDNSSSDAGPKDGWGDDDDLDIDLSEHHHDGQIAASKLVPATIPEQQQISVHSDRNMSVRFRSDVDSYFEPTSGREFADAASPIATENDQNTSQLYDAQMGEVAAVDDSVYYDLAPADENAWDDGIEFDETMHNIDCSRASTNDVSQISSPEHYAQFAEADTPPATPYTRAKPFATNPAGEQLGHLQSSAMALPSLEGFSSVLASCNTCANSSAIDCPCVNRILASSKDGWIPGGNGAKIDFNKLLQTEITKRLLLEEESKALRLQLEALKKSRGANEVLGAVKSLQVHVKEIEDRLGAKQQECDDVRSRHKEFQKCLTATQLELSEREARQDQWNRTEASLREELEQARSEIELSRTEGNRKLQERENELLAETEKRNASEGNLSHRLDVAQKECWSLRAEKEILCRDLEACRQTLTEQDAEMELLLSKSSAVDTETQRLKQSIDELETANASNCSAIERCQVLETELSSKEQECDQLRTQIDCLQQSLQAGEAEKFERIKEEARLLKTQSEEVARLQWQMNAVIGKKEENHRLREEENNDAGKKICAMEIEVKRLSAEKDALEGRIQVLQSSQATTATEIQSHLDQKSAELDSVKLDMELMKDEHERLSHELAEQSLLAQESQSFADDLRAVKDERDALQRSLAEAMESIATLQQRADEHRVEEAEIVALRNVEMESLKSECASLRASVASGTEDLEHLLMEAGRLSEENEDLHQEIADLKTNCGNLETALETARSDAATDEATRTQLDGEVESLQKQVSSIAAERDALKQELMTLQQKFSGIEDSVNRARRDFESNTAKVKSLESLLTKTQAELAVSRVENDAISAERYGMEEKHTASLAEMSTTLAALQAKLALQHQSALDKNDTIAELQRALEASRSNVREGEAATVGRIRELEDLVARLQAQKVDLKNALDFHSAQEKEYQLLSVSLHEARDAALRERDSLAEENEEMLVQFGVLNEGMDSYSQKIHSLQNQLLGYKTAAEATELRLAETQMRLKVAEEATLENASQRDSRTEVLEQAFVELRDEKNLIIQKLEDTASLSAEKENQIHALTEELRDLRSHLSHLEEIEHDMKAKQLENERLVRAIEDIKNHREQLENLCERQKEEAAQLIEQVIQSQSALSALHTRNAALEHACSDRDHALQQKDFELRELHGRVHVASDTSEVVERMMILRDRLTQMEQAALASTDRIRELEGLYSGSLEELGITKEKISETEATVVELQRESKARHEAEERLNETLKAINDLTDAKKALISDVAGLRFQLQAERQRNAALAHMPSEIESLSSQLRALQETLDVSKIQHTSREEELQCEVSGLCELMTQKEESITALQRSLDSIDDQLRSSENKAELEKANAERLKTELEDFHRQERETTARATSTADLLRFTKENAEDLETLRSTVITLASALEKSEIRRADAMDRLMKERETHADSLRRVSDSVKRFYTTLSFGES